MNTDSENPIPENAASMQDEEYVSLDPVAYVHALWQYKLLLIAAPLILAALFYALSYTQPKLFTSTVRFMPPSRSTGGLLISFGRTSSGDEYRAELASRTVGLDVARHLHIAERFHLKDEDTAWGLLLGMTKFDTDVNNFVTITARAKDPNFATEVANEYYAALNRFLEGLSRHEAEHRLNYMSGPLDVERQRLRDAEESLREAQEKTGLVLPEAQASLGVQQVSSLRSRISELNAQLANVRAGATDANPRVVAIQSEIANLEAQAQALEKRSKQVNSPAQLPELSLEVTRRAREVQFHTQTVEALTRSLETLQTTESYTPSLSLIDLAYPAKAKSSPSRKLWAVVGFVLGFVLVFVWIIVRTGYREWAISPRGTAALSRWRQSWWKRSQKVPAHAG